MDEKYEVTGYAFIPEGETDQDGKRYAVVTVYFRPLTGQHKFIGTYDTRNWPESAPVPEARFRHTLRKKAPYFADWLEGKVD